MKSFPYRQLLPIVCTSLALSGCIDDNYDLSDVDTTVKVAVEDLVVPINIDNAKLSNIFSLSADSKVKEYNGEYAFIEDGDFNSDDISIHAIHLDGPDIAPIVTEVNFTGINPASRAASASAFRFPLTDLTTTFHTESYDVNSSIVSLTHIGAHFTLTISMKLPALDGMLNSFSIENMVLKFPAGLDIKAEDANYDATTGLLTVGKVQAVGSTVSLVVPIAGVNPAAAGVVFTPAHNHVAFTGELSIKGGTLCIDTDDIKAGSHASMPSTFDFITAFDMSDIDVTDFSGRMRYTIDGATFSDVSITDLPDVLNQPGTDIRIANPQIYVKLNNPLYRYSLSARTGMEITSYKNGTQVGSYALNAPGYFDIAGNPAQPECYFCLSPEAPAEPYPGYGTPTHVGYAALANVLSGNGIPSKLHVFFDEPCIPEQTVENLPLGTSLGNVKGTYTFFAPLALGAGAKIVYSDTVDGWSSEDLDHITIETLTVDAVLDSDIPVAIDFTGYPIDKDGHQLDGVTITGAHLNANAKGQEVSISISGAIKGLDGIHFTATVSSDEDAAALAPGMTIDFKNIRPRVTGYYEKEL